MGGHTIAVSESQVLSVESFSYRSKNPHPLSGVWNSKVKGIWYGTLREISFG